MNLKKIYISVDQNWTRIIFDTLPAGKFRAEFSDFGSEGWRFESSRARLIFLNIINVLSKEKQRHTEAVKHHALTIKNRAMRGAAWTKIGPNSEAA